MTDTLLPQLFRALDLVVIERQPNGAFHLLTPAPVWLQRAFDAAPAGASQTLTGAFTFLADVVQQALGAWPAGPHASMVFGPFAATVSGDDLLLRATALTIDKRMLLVLDRLVGAADARPMLQKAREHLLENEQLVRKVEALHEPAAALDRAVAEMVGMASAEQQPIADALRDASAGLRAALVGLPAPPPRRRR